MRQVVDLADDQLNLLDYVVRQRLTDVLCKSYVKFADPRVGSFENRAHFSALAFQVGRFVLQTVDVVNQLFVALLELLDLFVGAYGFEAGIVQFVRWNSFGGLSGSF